jgi:hypothetical protein
MTILSDRQKVLAVEKPDEANWTPKAVGGLRMNKTESQFLVSVPFDAVPLLATILQAGKIEYVMLSGPELYRSQSAIQSIRFEKEYAEHEW